MVTSKNSKLISVSEKTLEEIDNLKPHRENDSWTTKLNNIIDEHKRMLKVLRNYNLVFEE